MPIERWGSLSVADHVDTAALAANVLLYDRLVVPIMTHQADRDERAYWEQHGWHPDLQANRVAQLGELAVRKPWDRHRRELFRTRAQQLAAEQGDAAGIDHMHLTRRILAQEQVVDTPAGVHVQVIAAYNSAAALKRDYRVADAPDHLSAQALLLTRRLAVPELRDPEDSLRVAIDLSRDDTFRQKRADLFGWQELMALRGIPPHAVVDELAAMADAYNDEVRKAGTRLRWKYASTIFQLGAGLLIAGPAGLAGAAAGAALSWIHFAVFDGHAESPGENLKPAAMFHHARQRLGLKLKT